MRTIYEVSGAGDVASQAGDAARLARHRCQSLLEDAVKTATGSAGLLFADGMPGPLASYPIALADQGAIAEKVAAQCMREGRSALLTAPGAEGPDGPPAHNYLGLPLLLDGEVSGALVVGGIREGSSIEVELRLLRPHFLERLALSVDRARVLWALARRGDEVSALRQQLDAFAIDFRSTYAAERARTAQLSTALGELDRTYRATVSGLALAVEAKDECTGGHLYRVSRYGMLVTALVAPEHAHDPQFEYGFLLHDIGKLMVPDEVLNKPGALSEDEWVVMKAHPGNGRSILEGISFLEGAREIVYSHHERWDGQGYPRGLREAEIPLGARIFPLCDAFDAMTSDRPYRKALPLGTALDEVCRGAGTQFWPPAVEAFMSLPREALLAIMETHSPN
jgi:cyclic di-GMP phosphodiesterase